MSMNDIPVEKRTGAAAISNTFLIQRIIQHMLAKDHITKDEIAAFTDGMPDGHARTVAENTLEPFLK